MNRKILGISLSLWLASVSCMQPVFAAVVSDGTNASGETYTASAEDESAVDVSGNAVVTISDSVITAAASNATGVFAYDEAVIHISDCAIDVTGGGAGGVQVAGGGTLYGKNLTVTSASKAATPAREPVFFR